MANANGLITAPVSFADVKAVLGISSNDLSGLCTSTKINMMAKYKPVRYSADTMSQWDTSNNTWKSSATWYKANNGAWGANVYSSTTWANIVNYTTGNTNGWGQSWPAGGSSAPYRLQDFAGYSHDSGHYYIDCPTSALTSSTVTVSLKGQGTNGISINSRLNTYYLGAAFVNTGNTTVRRLKTSTSTSSTAVTFSSIYFGASGTFRIVPFFSSKVISEGNSIPSGTIFCTIPYAYPSNILITASTPTYYANFSISNSTNKTSPAVNFRDANGLIVGSFSRINGSQTIAANWTDGTAKKISYAENGGPIKYMTITGYDGTVILSKTQLSTYGFDITLTNTINVTDYRQNNRTLFITFSDS